VRFLLPRLVAPLALAATAATVDPLAAANQARVEVTPAAALEGSHGLRVTFDGRIAGAQRAHVLDDTPAAERIYRAEFLLDVGAVVMAGRDSLVVFDGLAATTGTTPTPVFRVHLDRRFPRLPPRLIGEVWNDGRRSVLTSAASLAGSGSQRVRVEWRAASAPRRGDGLLRITVLRAGGPPPRQVSVSNSRLRLETVRLGAVQGIDRGSRGALRIDDFASFRKLAE
jgi:hypothetical protein